MRHQLVGLLGGTVEAQGMINVVGSTKRHSAVGAIDGGGRGINEMPASRVPTTLEHIEKTGKIGMGVGMRIDQRMTHAGLRSQMHDGGKTIGGKQFRHGL